MNASVPKRLYNLLGLLCALQYAEYYIAQKLILPKYHSTTKVISKNFSMSRYQQPF